MIGIVAHRGGALLWPENSRSACRHAAALGVDEIQLDVHGTDAGEVVVIHDATLERTTQASGPVAALSQARRRQVTLRGDDGETLPVLDDLIDILRPSPCLIRLELKRLSDGARHPRLFPALRERLQISDLAARTVLSAFALEDVLLAMQDLPARHHIWLLSTALLAERPPPVLLQQAVDHGIRAIGLRWSAACEGFAGLVRQAGLKLDLFGCNTAEAIEIAFAAAPDSLTTDRPDLALQRRLRAFQHG